MLARRLPSESVVRFRPARVALLLAAVCGTVFAEDKPPEAAKPASALKTTASLEVSGYADSDHVDVVTPTIAGAIADDVAGWSIGGRYLVDVVSAASVDIVSSASGRWLEYRHVGSANGSLKVGDVTAGASGIVSNEPDYHSFAAGANLAVDLFDKNLSPFAGFSYAHDSVGRTGLPLGLWHTLQTYGIKLGTTFVVSRSTIASLQGDAILERGYLAKPYRYLPLFAPGTADAIPAGASVALVNQLRLDQHPGEQVPSARDRYALSGRMAHRFDASTLRVDERLYADSWSVLASTSDARYLLDVGRRLIVWPHLRFHAQRQASFWKRAYEALPGPGGTLGIPVFRTGDRELGPLFTASAGVGARLKLTDDVAKRFSLVFELDGGYTRYFDALYITQRRSLLGTLAIESELE